MKLIFKYFREAMNRYRNAFLLSLVLILLVSAGNMLIPFGLRIFLDRIIVTNDLTMLLYGLLVFAVFLLLVTFVYACWYVSLDHFGGLYIEDLLLRMEDTLAKTSLDRIERKQYNVIKNIMYSDVLDVFRVIGHHFPSLIGSILVMIFMVALAFSFDIKLSLFIFVSILLGFGISYLSRTIIAKTAKSTNLRLKQVNAQTNEFVDSIMLVQTNHISAFFQKKMSQAVTDFIHTAKKEDFILYCVSGVVENYNTLFKIALSALLSLPFVNGSLVNLVFFTMLANMVLSEANKCEGYIRQIYKASISFVNVDEVLNFEPRQKQASLTEIQEIDFHNVSFAYDADHPVLNQINGHIQSKDCIHLMGANGSGKSTLVKLMMGLYQPSEGQITFNDQDVKEYVQEDLNRSICYLGQDEILLNTTIKEYLEIMSASSLNEQVIDQGRKLFGIDYFDRKIEKEGQSLSVGQRKKVLLMKLMLRLSDASLVILDEIGAGLDIETKKQLKQILKEYVIDAGKMLILIEHDSVFDDLINQQWKIEDHKIYVR